MRFILIFIWFALLFDVIHAQTGNPGSVRAIAISEADITGSSGWAGFDNPAGLGGYSDYSMSICYQNRYLIPELGTQMLCGTIPTASGTFSPVFSYFGSKAYNRTGIALAYGLALNSWLNAGIRLQYNRINVEAVMHGASAVTGDLAIIAKAGESIAIGAMLVNPTRTRYNNLSGDYIPGGFRLGASYSVEKSFCIASSLNWDDFKKLECSFGTEYKLCRLLIIRAGIRLPERLSYSFGLGMVSGSFCFDIGFEQHPLLGLSSALALTYKIG
jgi:hypothetical protein